MKPSKRSMPPRIALGMSAFVWKPRAVTSPRLRINQAAPCPRRFGKERYMWKTTLALFVVLILICAGCSTVPSTRQTNPISKPDACLRTCPDLEKVGEGDYDAWVLDLIGRYAECRRLHDSCRGG